MTDDELAAVRSGRRTNTIHAVSDGYVISDGWWLPGVYADCNAADYAKRLHVRELETLWRKVREQNRTITIDDLTAAYRK